MNKEPMRLIDSAEILNYEGAHFTWSGGKNCLTEEKLAYAKGYDAGMKFIVDEVKKLPTIEPNSLRSTAKWEKSFYESREDGKFIVCTRCRHTFSKKGLWCRKYCSECGARMVNADD